MTNKAKLIILFTVSIALSVAIGFGFLEKFEYYAYDNLYAESNEKLDDVIIVAIDDTSIEQIGRFPWSRDVYATLIDNLVEGGAAAIGFDIIFSEEEGEADYVFRDAISRTDTVTLAINAEMSGDVKKEDKTLQANYFYYPNQVLMESNPNLGFINSMMDSDNVVRRALTYMYDEEYGDYKNSFNYELYQTYAKANGLGERYIDTSYFSRPYIYYAGGAGSIETVSFSQVLNKEIPPEYFENKIVLVGIEASGGQDVYYTPVGPMYGVEIHANFINNLILNNFKTNLIAENIVYLTENTYFDITKFLTVLLAALIYIYIALKVSRSRQKSKISAIVILGYFLTEILFFKVGYIIFVLYPIIVTLVLYIVDMGIDFYRTRQEKIKITNIFNKYMSKEIVDKIVLEGEESIKLGGDKKDATVMFIDIRGFTTISETLEPEEVVDILNEYLTMATEQIIKHNGVLDKYIGDGIMALFNVPYTMEDPELSCIKAALDIKSKSTVLYNKLYEKYQKGVEFGIGINCGNAIVGNIGSEKRMDYTAIGDTVNTAARLESNAQRGQILISDELYSRVADKVNVNVVGELKLKGKEKPLLTYEVIDIL